MYHRRIFIKCCGQNPGYRQRLDFEHNLDGYEPAKKQYNFYFTYKIVHPWWDATERPVMKTEQGGAQDTLAKYPDMEIVAVEYDNDSIDKAYDLTVQMLKDNPDINGFICCNISNPVGTARAVTELGSDAVIVGMDHDREALHYLQNGVIYCLGVQDCYSIGFDTLQVAVKIADGHLPGSFFPDKTAESTTIIYQEDAVPMLEVLYGDVSQ